MCDRETAEQKKKKLAIKEACRQVSQIGPRELMRSGMEENLKGPISQMVANKF